MEIFCLGKLGFKQATLKRMEHRCDIYKVNWKNKANRLTATGHRSPKGAEPTTVVDKTFFFHTKTKSRSKLFQFSKIENLKNNISF